MLRMIFALLELQMNPTYFGKKTLFQKNLLYFKLYTDFEADKETDISSLGNKTTNIYKQSPVLNGYYIISELGDVLQSNYHKSPLGYDNIDWFVDEIKKLESKETFYFKNSNIDINMTEEDEGDLKNKNICRFCDKEILSDKVRDLCHLTSS